MSLRPRRLDYLCEECGAKMCFPTDDFVRKYRTCEECKSILALSRCSRNSCQFYKWVCFYCEKGDLEGRLNRHNEPSFTSTSAGNYLNPVSCWWVAAGFGVILVFSLLFMHRSESIKDGNEILIKNLIKYFPSQRNETWFHFLSVLEKGVPSVKSITFLHGEDKKTSDCLIKKLVFLYSGNKTIKREDITFSAVGYEEMDYGFALEHYRLIVDTFRVFVTDLMEVPGNIARIFHSLCDEVSSDIKPSLFIFALKFDKRTERLKPMARAETILKETWSELPENELSPLLSRIVRNVVDVVPEIETNCNW